MAVPVIAATETFNSSATSTSSFSIPLPTHSEGDLLLMQLLLGVDRTPTVSGWTAVANHSSGSGNRVYIYAKMAGASEGASKTISTSAADFPMCAVSAITGAADIAVTPIVAGTAGGSTSATNIAPAIEATTNDSLIIIGACDSGGGPYGTTKSGYTLIANLENVSSFDDTVMFYRNTGAAAGTVDAVTVASATGYGWVAWQLAIAPSAGGSSAIPAFIHHRRLLGVQ